MVFCPYCGAKNGDSSKFCVICGKELPDNTGNGFDPYDTTRNDPESKAGRSDNDFYRHKDEGIMVVLSIIFPGLGVLVAGKTVEGLALIIANLICFALGIFLFLPLFGCLVIWVAGIMLTHQYVTEYNHTLDVTGVPPW